MPPWLHAAACSLTVSASLVCGAYAEQVLPAIHTDVSEALHVLIVDCMEPRVDKRVFADYNRFRARCYDPSVTAVLADNEPSLRHLIAVAAGAGAAGQRAHEAQLLSLGEWTRLLKALGLIGRDVTERDARLCFSCSRMAVVDGRTLKGRSKEDNLPFEGFLEALCRLSCLKALPTDAELERTGCADAGIFLQRLHAGSLPEEFTDEFDTGDAAFADEAAAFMDVRAAAWGEESVHPLECSVRHLIACIVRTVEEDSHGADNMQLTLNEVKNWAKNQKEMGCR